LQVRNKGDKIGVWLGNGKMASNIMHVGHVLKARLGITQPGMLSFEAHEDTMHKAGSTAKSKFTV
jgi:translation initiation factor 4E